MNISYLSFLFLALLPMACGNPESRHANDPDTLSFEPSTYELVKETPNNTKNPQLPQEGRASFYADRFQGRPTASGAPYDSARLTAAHRSLPFGTKAKVTNLRNDKSVEVTINDRGPHHPNRIIDLSKAAARKLGFIDQGVVRVRVEEAKNEN